MNGLVYHAFDTTNGKAYVGQTASSLEERRKEHLSCRDRRPFLNALRKRSHAFVWTVLTSGLTSQEDLDKAEIYWGTFFECLVPRGYNLRLGSGHVMWSEAERARNRQAQLLASARPDVRAKRSRAQKLSKSDPAVREKIRQSLRKKPFRPDAIARSKMSAASIGNLPNKRRDKNGRWIK